MGFRDRKPEGLFSRKTNESIENNQSNYSDNVAQDNDNWGDVECVYGPDLDYFDDDKEELNNLLKSSVINVECTAYMKEYWPDLSINIYLKVKTSDGNEFNVIFYFNEEITLYESYNFIIKFVGSPKFNGLVTLFYEHITGCYLSVQNAGKDTVELKLSQTSPYKEYLNISITI